MRKTTPRGKEERREALTGALQKNPCLTDADLSRMFGVSVATIRLDRQALGIPQMRSRILDAVASLRSEGQEELVVFDVDQGRKGFAMFCPTPDMASRDGFVGAEHLYGAAAELAELIEGERFTPVQVGNIKYKIPVYPGTSLIAKGEIARFRGDRKYIYISFSSRADEVFRAKFIMEVAK